MVLRFLPVLALLLTCPVGLVRGELPALGANSQQEPVARVRDQLQLLLKAGERVRDEELRALAKVGTKRAFDALEQVTSELNGRFAILRAYRSFQEFRPVPELWSKALDYLSKEALRHQKEDNRSAAARALAEIGAPATAQLTKVLKKSKDEVVRRRVAPALIDHLVDQGDRKSLDLLLENLELAGRNRSKLRDALQAKVAGDTEEAQELAEDLARRLQKPKVGAGIGFLLLEALSSKPSPIAVQAIAACVDHESAELSLRAIHLLGATRDREHLGTIEPLTRDSRDEIVRAAIDALSMIYADDPAWFSKVLRWSKDRRVGARLGACLALARYKDKPSAKRLHELLEDSAWQVRLEVVQQLVQLRRKASIPILIDRLRLEEGRLEDDIARALRLLSGLDHGRGPVRWLAWWEGEGDSFEVPTLEAALAAEKKRTEKPGDKRSSVGFYGLRVTSNSVIFVVDISGSMNGKASGGRTGSPGELSPSRLSVARQELENTVQGLAEGVLFNIITFGTAVRAWQEELIAMDRGTRDQAVEYAREISSGGGTNTFGALMQALEDARVDTIYLLSDGRPSTGEVVSAQDIRERVRLMNSVRKVRIHCISIGQASAFMRELAEDTGGRYVEVL